MNVCPHPGPTGFGILVTNNGMSVIDWARALTGLSIDELEQGLSLAGGRATCCDRLHPPASQAAPGFGGTLTGGLCHDGGRHRAGAARGSPASSR
jgi:hypothetical protein